MSTKVRKSCVVCGVDLGMVYGQTKYCETHRMDRRRHANRRSDKKRREKGRVTGDEATCFTLPSPCYTTPEETEALCPHFASCRDQLLACRSYWQYTNVGLGTAHEGETRSYLGLPREPNAGYYLSAFADDSFYARRVEGIRILRLIPQEFSLGEFMAVDSFLDDKQKRLCLNTLVDAHLVARLGGRVQRKATKFLNVVAQHPEALAIFTKKHGADPSREEGGAQPKPAPISL